LRRIDGKVSGVVAKAEALAEDAGSHRHPCQQSFARAAAVELGEKEGR
jgi:hypothetical protein